jgi:hypothetical protein
MYVTRPEAMSGPSDDLASITRELADRTEIVDALYRFALGQDLQDKCSPAG